MKILLALQYFYPYTNGGTELYVYDLAKELIAKGNDVAILKIGPESNYNYNDIKIYVLPEGNFSNELSDKEYSILTLFRNLLNDFSPDIFHLNTLHEKLNGYFLKEAKKKGIICAFTNHLASTTCTRGDLLLMGKKQCDGTFSYKRCFKCTLNANKSALTYASYFILTINRFSNLFLNKSSALRALYETKTQLDLLKSYSDLIFVQSEWQKKVLLLNNFNSDKLYLIRLALTNFRSEYPKIRENNSKTSFGFIGRYSKNKGIEILIDALKKIKIPLNLFYCISIGEEDINAFEELIAPLKSIHNIKINYNASKDTVIKTLDSIDALIVPSLVVETGPYVVLEALSRNTPVIGSNIGGISEMIHHKQNGFLFEMGNVNDLSNAVENFIKNPIVILNNNQSNFAINSIQQYASEIEKKYKQAIGNK